MIERITSQSNPNLLYLQHSMEFITNLILIPRFFFTPEIIIKRSPLKQTARRAGWIGCNIDLSNIPTIGKIRIIHKGTAVKSQTVIDKYKKAIPLKTVSINERGWLYDIFLCLDRLGVEFELSDVYAFENKLSNKHPANKNIRPKIRQQLQLLREKGVVEFFGNGRYKKI